MTTRTQQTTPGRWVLPFLAALVTVLATLLSTATASAATDSTAEIRVRAHSVSVEPFVGPPVHIRPGQRLGEPAAGPEIVVATGVAAKTGSALVDAGMYDYLFGNVASNAHNAARFAERSAVGPYWGS